MDGDLWGADLNLECHDVVLILARDAPTPPS